MAENQEDRSREDLTEEASPYRIEEFRRKGMVAQSREVTGLARAARGRRSRPTCCRPGWGRSSASSCARFSEPIYRRASIWATPTSRRRVHGQGAASIAMSVLPICIAGFISGVVGSFAQIGSIWSTDPLMPDFGKINPLEGLQAHVLDAPADRRPPADLQDGRGRRSSPTGWSNPRSFGSPAQLGNEPVEHLVPTARPPKASSSL